MTKENHTALFDFIFVGYPQSQNLQGFLFGVFLCTYVGIITGNGLIIFITITDPSLHTPMYFFLKKLSFLEICYTSVTLPKILTSLMAEKKSISFIGCAAQMYFIYVIACTECLILTGMAYDRYVAICNPLQYGVVMSKQLCVGLVTGSLIVSIAVHTLQVYLVFTLPFCGSHEINNFFCDVPPLLELACADTYKNEVTLYAAVTLFLIAPFILIFSSYVKIISVILKMSSVEGRKKVFATCSSHLTVVVLFYGSATAVYLCPRSKESIDTNKLLSLLYTILIPMLNPIVYSLRNREVKDSLKKHFSRKNVI